MNVYSEIYKLAAEIREIAPWKRMDEVDIFGVRIPESDQIYFISVMGKLGEFTAISAYRGLEGLAGFNLIQDQGDELPPETILTVPHFILSFADREDLSPYQLVSSREQMSVLPQSSGELLSLLKERHRVLLGARSNQQPGLFKVQNNKAGNTLFVDWELVAGTLTRGFEICQALSNPFKRAAYMLFMVSEVHPFKDGNGRIARIMMNAELVAAGQARIMIPTVYREDYLGALRKLTRRSQATAFLRMLDRVADFSLTVQGEDMDKMQIYLESCNAFTESTEGALRF